MMKNLIELDATLDALREVIVPAEDIGFGDESTDGYNDGIDMAITVMCGMPTVDAVPVVRCKDCIHWGKFPVSTVLPQYHKCGMATYKSTKGDDFCSDGRNRDPEPLKRGKNMCNYKIFSKMLKEQLKKKGMTQKELAERIDTTEVSVSRYVSGQRIPKATVLLKIATALGVSTDYLLGAEEKGSDNG